MLRTREIVDGLIPSSVAIMRSVSGPFCDAFNGSPPWSSTSNSVSRPQTTERRPPQRSTHKRLSKVSPNDCGKRLYCASLLGMPLRIAIIATGGTIASTTTEGGVVANQTAATLLEGTGIAGVEIETIDLMTIGSYRMTLGHLRQISDQVADLLAREHERVDGIVITHGTDTMEETAILLDLVHDDPRPLVLTGAQHPSDAVAGDGPRNLADAVRVAASPDARALGVLIAFAGRILPARGTRKMHTTALAAFDSMVGGSVGNVSGGAVSIISAPAPSQAATAAHPRVRQHPGRSGRDVSGRRRRVDPCSRRGRGRRV